MVCMMIMLIHNVEYKTVDQLPVSFMLHSYVETPNNLTMREGMDQIFQSIRILWCTKNIDGHFQNNTIALMKTVIISYQQKLQFIYQLT